MSELEITVIWAIVIFVLTFLINFFGILCRGLRKLRNKKYKKKIKEIKDFAGMSLVVNKFNLDVEKMNIKYAFTMISLINAFIISFVFLVISLVPWHMSFRMLLAFVLLFGLIYALYDILGKHFVKKGWTK